LLVIAAAKKFLWVFLERLSFLLWIAFTIFAVVLIGLGVMSILYSGIILLGSGAQPLHLPLLDSRLTPAVSSEAAIYLPPAMIVLGVVATLVSLRWRQIGIDRLHYLELDSLVNARDEEETFSHTLDNLILEVEESRGNERTEARAKAKAWLLTHVGEMDEEDILLARAHFSYLLPPQWEAGARARRR